MDVHRVQWANTVPLVRVSARAVLWGATSRLRRKPRALHVLRGGIRPPPARQAAHRAQR